MKRIVLYDGECNVCHWAVQWIIRHDPAGKFHFAALQSKVGQSLVESARLTTSLGESIILIENNQYYQESTAVLRISRELEGLWRVISVALWMPRPLRDPLYRWFARNRYRWFGKRRRCLLLTADIRSRFLE